jgi:hypothetical protein
VGICARFLLDKTMTLEIIGGLIIGFVVRDWVGRLIIPFFIGLWTCGELFFVLRKKFISGFRKHEFLKAGISKSEIEGINKSLRMPLRQPGVAGWIIYAQQFMFSTIITLAFSILAGVVKQVFFNKP